MAFVYGIDWRFFPPQRPQADGILDREACKYGRLAGCTLIHYQIWSFDNEWVSVCGMHLAAGLGTIPYR